MDYRTIQYVDKPVSKIVFGCANPAMLQGKRVYRLLDEALDSGITTFDTAESYGSSEDILGKWMKLWWKRNKVVLITKGCHPHGRPRVTPEDLKEDIHKSLKRLKTDYIDIYMLHRDHPDADLEAILEVLNEYHKAGKIGAFGASNWTHDRIAKVNEYALKKRLIPFTVSSPNYGPATQVTDPWGGGCVSIAGKENEEARKWYIENKLPIFAYSCLGRGMFSGKVKTNDLENSKRMLDKYALQGYWCQENIDRLARMEILAKEKECSISQLALAWIMQQKMEVFPIITVSDKKRIIENLSALNIRLSKYEMNIISGDSV